MIAIRRLNLFPIIFSFRRFGVLWQRLGYCCGNQYYEMKWLLLLRFAFSEEIVWTCPQCNKRHRIRLIYNAVEIDNKNENKNLRKW